MYVYHEVLDVCMYIIGCWLFVCTSSGVGCLYIIRCWMFVCISSGVGCLYVYHQVLDVCTCIIGCWTFVCIPSGAGCLHASHRVFPVDLSSGSHAYVCHQVLQVYNHKYFDIKCVSSTCLSSGYSHVYVCQQVYSVSGVSSHVYQVYNHMFVFSGAPCVCCATGV